MAKFSGRIAVASSDGIVVNNHFGRARKFYVYDYSDEQLNLVEIREVVPACEGGNHEQSNLEKNIKVISDCNYLLVSRIGDGALRIVETYGIDTYEIPGIINESIKQLSAYVELKELFS